MRNRLTISFVLLSMSLLLMALGIRSITTVDLLRGHESVDIDREATRIATLVGLQQDSGGPVDEAFLRTQVAPDERLAYTQPDGEPLVVSGPDFTDGDPDAIAATKEPGGGGRLTLERSATVVEEFEEDTNGSLWLLVLLVGLLAGLGGYVIARALSRPFQRLAVAAAQLGRGRFDLDLPRSRIPEARAISLALLGSAGQLQERLASEQAFAEQASHAFRSPLTGLRLELEDIAQRADLPGDVRDTADRCVARIEAMDLIAGDLVSLARSGALVAGADVPLRELAVQCAQVWAYALATQDRRLTAAAEGSIETTYTPGPVEHILDLLLRDVMARGQGEVRMVFEADQEGSLSIEVSSAGGLRAELDPSGAGRSGDDVRIIQARAVVSALGGRLTGEDPRRLTILLPRH